MPEPQALDGPWAQWAAATRATTRSRSCSAACPRLRPILPSGGRATRRVLLGPDGARLGVYRKIHLFDIDLPGMEHLKESKGVAPGGEVVVAQAPQCRIGLSICYDLRFPELYRGSSTRAPTSWPCRRRSRSAPARTTGRCCCARAPSRTWPTSWPGPGRQPRPGRASYGHALIVDPWGTVLAQVPTARASRLRPSDFERQDRLRRELPALSHRRRDATFDSFRHSALDESA